MKRVPLWVKLLVPIVLVAAVCVGLTFVPSGQVGYAPLEPIDLDGRVTVQGRVAEPVQGHIAFAGVQERPLNALQRGLLSIGDRSVDFGPEPEAATSVAAARAADVQDLLQSEERASVVALRLLGERVEIEGKGAIVTSVLEESPARGILQGGDLIVDVNGRPTNSSLAVDDLIGKLPPGTRVRVGVRRAGVGVSPVLRTMAPIPGDSQHRSRIGADLTTVALEVALPEKVSFKVGADFDPSAALPFALYLYDARSGDDLLRGRFIVAAGDLTIDGQVREIEHMRQRAIAAQRAHRDILIVPMANRDEAKEAVRSACSDGGRCIRVIGVDSVGQAVELLKVDDAALDHRLSKQ